MKNPVNRLATAAPRALDSLLETKTKQQEEDDNNKQKKQQQQKKKERTCSFDLDLSGLNLLDNSSINGGGSTLGSGSTIGSITEECNGSVVTFEELDGWDMVNSSTDDLMFEKPSPN